MLPTEYHYYPTTSGKEAKKQMNIEREFTVFENDMDWRKRKRLQLSEEDDFRRAIFTVD